MAEKEFRAQSSEELVALVKEKRHTLFTLRNQRRMHVAVEKPHRLRSLRKEIAMILTILREREVSQAAV